MCTPHGSILWHPKTQCITPSLRIFPSWNFFGASSSATFQMEDCFLWMRVTWCTQVSSPVIILKSKASSSLLYRGRKCSTADAVKNKITDRITHLDTLFTCNSIFSVVIQLRVQMYRSGIFTLLSEKGSKYSLVCRIILGYIKRK